MEQIKSVVERLHEQFEKEKQLTKEALADVIQFLSHSTALTRRQLIQELQMRIDVINAEMSIDRIGDIPNQLISIFNKSE